MDQSRRGNIYILGAVVGVFCIALLAMGIYWTRNSAAPNALTDSAASERAKGDVLSDKTTKMQAPAQPGVPTGEQRR